MPPRKKTTRTRSRPSRSPHRSRGWLRLLLGLFLMGLVLTGLYSLHLAREVRIKFEGKKWSIPARVYARALDLYVGAELPAKRLQAELQMLGYRKVSGLDAEAEWSGNDVQIRIWTRGFRFWDSLEPSRQVDIRFDGDVVGALTDVASGQALDLFRLEPPEIGSIYPSHNEDRVLVKREELPDHLIKALLATEDQHYFQHFGVDPIAIARAMLANIRAGKAVQGGSTLTQQLVKNFYLTDEKSLLRKFNEALMAMLLEARYSKDEILEAYANEVYLGQDGPRAIHGFGLASWYYFGRPLNELRMQETAILVALLKGATLYNPIKHPERAKERRDLVLKVMAEQGYITEAEASKAQATPLGVNAGVRRASSSQPAFIDLVRRQLKQDYQEEDLTSEGLRIFTTLDPWVQAVAANGLEQGLEQVEKNRKLKPEELEGAAVVVSPQGGEVLALVGGRQANYVGFNRALDAVRPIGSLVKPFVYLAALGQDQRFTLVSPLKDQTITLPAEPGKTWTPQNYDKKEHGTVLLYRALAQSYNLATVRLGVDVGLPRIAAFLKQFGIQRDVLPLPSLLLGSLSLSPLEVAQMYQPIAGGGFLTPLRAIRDVTTSAGEPLKRYDLEVRQVANTDSLHLLNYGLTEVMRSGTGKSAYSQIPEGTVLAGKTGTTNDLRDSWFAGFGADVLAVVWLGRDDNESTGVSGSTGALQVWARMMHDLRPLPLSLVPPDNVRYQWVNRNTGYLSAESCPDAAKMPFISGTEPSAVDECVPGVRNYNPLLEWLH